MKKTWFIIEKDHHRGPYTFEELKNFKVQGKLSDNSMLWQEGNASGLSFKDACEIERKISETLIPDVPNQFRTEKSSEKNQDEPPLFPGEQVFANEKFIKPTVQTATLDKIGTNLSDKIVLDEVTKAPLNKVVGIYFACLLGLILFIGGGLFYFYIGRTPQLSFPDEMSRTDYDRLSLVVDTRFVPNDIFEIATSKDLSRLWLAINYPFSAELQLEMASIPEMTWQRKSVKVRSKAPLENYLAEFKDFIVDSEDGKFYPGFYNLKVSLVELGEVNLISKLIFRDKQFKEINIKQFYWGQGDKQEFLELVSKSMPAVKTAAAEEVPEEIESEVVQKFREKEEKYRTLLSLVNLTDEHTKNTFALIENENQLKDVKVLKKTLTSFEKKYLKEVAPLLTSIGQDDEVQEAKVLGKLFVEILDSLRKELKPRGKTKRKALVFSSFAQNYLLKFKELAANLEAILRSIEEQILKQKTEEKTQANSIKTH